LKECLIQIQFRTSNAELLRHRQCACSRWQKVFIVLLYHSLTDLKDVVVVVILELSPDHPITLEPLDVLARALNAHQHLSHVQRLHSVVGVHQLVCTLVVVVILKNPLNFAFNLALFAMSADEQQRQHSVTILFGASDLQLHLFLSLDTEVGVDQGVKCLRKLEVHLLA